MDNTASGTSTPNAKIPKSQEYINPRDMRLERQGADTVPSSRRFPAIIGGVCEWCGILDSNMPGHLQYKLCPHYRGKDMKCIYCPAEKDQTEVLRTSYLNVAEHPYQNGVLIAWCNSTECARKHMERFKVSR